jgi:hypothetical protein
VLGTFDRLECPLRRGYASNDGGTAFGRLLALLNAKGFALDIIGLQGARRAQQDYTFSEARNAIADLRELVPCLTQMRTTAPSPLEQAKFTRTIDWLSSFIDAADDDGPYE